MGKWYQIGEVPNTKVPLFRDNARLSTSGWVRPWVIRMMNGHWEAGLTRYARLSSFRAVPKSE